MSPRITGCCILIASLLLPVAAHAQQENAFGEQGQFILSVDRLMPLVSYEDLKVSQGGNKVSISSLGFSFVGHGETITLYNQPRFSFDYLITNGLTLGGSVYLYLQASNSVSVTANNVTTTTDGSKETLWGIAARVGYVIPISGIVSFWPRGGISFNDINYGSATATGGGVSIQKAGGSARQFAVDLEPTFVFTPLDHVGITASAIADIPVTGSSDVPTTTAAGTPATVSYDLTQFHIGVHAGLLVYF